MFNNNGKEDSNNKQNMSISERASLIIHDNLKEFSSMYIGKDPRLPDYEWITEDVVIKIHNELLHKVGGNRGIHNKIDLQYAINHPLTNIVGIENKTIFERICECAYLLAKCFVDCGAQVSATVFILLCEMNDIKVSFKLGELYDIFLQLIGPNMSFEYFCIHMREHLVPQIKEKTIGKHGCVVELDNDGIPKLNTTITISKAPEAFFEKGD